VMPMFFLSGALFPLHGLPTWLSIATKLDPLTYAVDPMRRAVLGEAGGAVSWGTWLVPTTLELAIVLATGLVALALAAYEFGKTE